MKIAIDLSKLRLDLCTAGWGEDEKERILQAVAGHKDTLFAIKRGSTNVPINGYKGTWYVIDSQFICSALVEGYGKLDSEYIYLLEHEEYGDETAHLIVNELGTVVIDEVYNGFGDFDERCE